MVENLRPSCWCGSGARGVPSPPHVRAGARPTPPRCASPPLPAGVDDRRLEIVGHPRRDGTDLVA
ncbi:MAG: hypothetical protein R2713_11065 [Ilumatobacteraceae bacterium]